MPHSALAFLCSLEDPLPFLYHILTKEQSVMSAMKTDEALTEKNSNDAVPWARSTEVSLILYQCQHTVPLAEPVAPITCID